MGDFAFGELYPYSSVCHILLNPVFLNEMGDFAFHELYPYSSVSDTTRSSLLEQRTYTNYNRRSPVVWMVPQL